jgi:hypothetical protein
MAKKSITKPVSVNPAPATRTRDTVFFRLNASKLRELIGDAEIGVSRKELKATILKAKQASVLAEAGL